MLSQEKTYGARDEKRAYFCLATFYSPNGKIELLEIYAKAKGERRNKNTNFSSFLVLPLTVTECGSNSLFTSSVRCYWYYKNEA